MVNKTTPASLHDPDEISRRAAELGIEPGFAVFVHDIPADEIPPLPATASPAPMPNMPITDIPDQNSGGPTNGT